MTPFYEDGVVRILHGDCRELLPGLTADVIVTDPPYQLAFMGRTWDRPTAGFHQAWAEAALQALPPGGWLLAFGGTRTWHRLACGLEDAGFEIRDTIIWLYGSGFPKSKACLKPAWEPVIVARKPGSSVLQIDACRVGTDSTRRPVGKPLNGGAYGSDRSDRESLDRRGGSDSGRWPPNVALVHSEGCQPVGTRKIRAGGGPATAHRGEVNRSAAYGAESRSSGTPMVHHYDPDGTETITAWTCEDDCPVALLDQQSGELRARGNVTPTRTGASSWFSTPATTDGKVNGGDQGGASRFYATFPGEARFLYTAKASRAERITVDGERHPTVKPLALMRWLVRLVASPGGTVLDPFCGSGSTLVAAVMEGFRAIGIEADERWCRGSAQRVAAIPPVQEVLAL